MKLVINDKRETAGVDPRSLDLETLRRAGHEKQPVLRAIRSKCLDCCGEQPGEVRRCTAVACPLWPYRMGSNPFDARTVAAAEKRSKDGDERAAAVAPAGNLP